MKSIFVFALAFGCALGYRPSVWMNSSCPPPDQIQDYIINGEDAEDGKYPYMLSLQYDNAYHDHICGGSILTKNWALTAAHCCAIDGQFTFCAGTNNWSRGCSRHKVEKKVMHEMYQPSDYWKNDICLVKVKTPFVFGPKVQQITLPPQDWPIPDGTKVNITGWGYTDPYDDDIPLNLQLGKNYISLSNEKCSEKTGQYHKSYLCVLGGKEGQGVCNGDSGSALVINGVQVGVASWVYLPCGCSKPDFFSRVPTFIDWIKKTLGPEASELKFMK